MQNQTMDYLRRILRVCWAVGIIAAVTFVYVKVVSVNSTTVALTLLLAVLGIATRWGLLESLTASVAGGLCFNYFFLPPVGAWHIADPQDWVAVFTFLATAAVGSQLSTSAKRRAVEATNRRHEMEQLYALSRSLMLMDPRSPPAQQIAGPIAEAFGFQTVVYYDRTADAVDRAGSGTLPLAEGRLRDAAIHGRLFVETAENSMVLPVSLGGAVIGSLALPSSPASETALHAIAHLAGVALERARGQEAASRAEAARQSEELKSAMLDALAHDFKTPLTSIKAAVTSILDDDVAAPGHRELLQIVDEETDRLASLVTEAIRMARLEAGQIEVRRAPQSVADLIRQSLAKLAGSLESRPLEVQVSEDLPPVAADPELAQIVIRQLVSNAVHYSPAHAPISIRAAAQGDFIVVGVADRGPGIGAAEQSRIFDRFYRGREARERIPGSGMGLAIARDIVRAHNGDIWVESRSGEGSRFLFSLPVAKEETRT